MKHRIFNAIFIGLSINAIAAVPLRWTVETSRLQPAAFDAYRGETLALEASFNDHGKPLEIAGEAALYYQTNGMGAAWWTAPATVSSNRIAAAFTPAMDPGAQLVKCFLGGTASTYRAAFTLRFAASPGATPNVLPPPTVRSAEEDPVFAAWLAANPVPGTVSNVVTRAYVESLGVQGGGVDVETDPTVPQWAKAADPLEAGVATKEYVDRATNEAARAALDADDVRGIVSGMGAAATNADGHLVFESPDNRNPGEVKRLELGFNPDYGAYSCGVFFAYGTDYYATGFAGNFFVSDWNNVKLIKSGGFGHETLPEYVQSVLPTAPEDVGAAPASLADTVNAWQTYWYGDDVRVTITNYYGSADHPHLYFEQKMPADESHSNAWYKTVWDELTRHAPILARLAAVEAELLHKADRAWGFYDSHAGTWAPEGFTSISSPNVLLAPGMSYQKTLTTGGCAVWVLKANDPAAVTGVSSNGFFRIEDGEGNALFEIVRGDKRTVGATATGLTTAGGVMEITYATVSDAHPALRLSASLENPAWVDEAEAASLASVAWSGQSGAWVATVTPVAALNSLFVQATYEVGGETYVRNSVPVSTDRVVVGGRFYRVAVETVNGRKLMVLTDE